MTNEKLHHRITTFLERGTPEKPTEVNVKGKIYRFDGTTITHEIRTLSGNYRIEPISRSDFEKKAVTKKAIKV